MSRSPRDRGRRRDVVGGVLIEGLRCLDPLVIGDVVATIPESSTAGAVWVVSIPS